VVTTGVWGWEAPSAIKYCELVKSGKQLRLCVSEAPKGGVSMSVNQVYPRANTIISIEDSKLMRKKQYDLLLGAGNLGAVLDELNTMDYFRTLRDADTSNYRLMLDELMKSVLGLLHEITPAETIWRMFTLLYDIHNMKLVVKERLTGKWLDSLALEYGSYSLPTIRSAAVHEENNILGNRSLTAGFFAALHADNLYDVDFILDKVYLSTLKDMALSLANPAISSFITEKIDLYNFSVFFQWLAAGRPESFLVKAFSEEGTCTAAEWNEYLQGLGRRTPDLSTLNRVMGPFRLWEKYSHIWEAQESVDEIVTEFDVRVDNYLVTRTVECKLIPFGILPICAFFFNKLIEIKNIRILLAGKERSLSRSTIRRRLRIAYEL